jgi:rhodanese-related sulfurtransferase
MVTAVNTQKALEYFDAKLEFTVDPFEVNDMLKRNEDFNLIDVRAEEDYNKGHIPGAISLPKNKWSTLEGLSHEKPNILYCYSISCYLATHAAREFAEKGYPVREMIGGFDSWKKYKFEVER